MELKNFYIAFFAGIIFAVSFRVNQIFDQYFVYSAGISLLFIPAGVKLLLLLVGRVPAYVGLLISGVYLGLGIWPDKELVSVFLFAFNGLTCYALVAYGLMKVLHIRPTLDNLRYGHIVLLSAVASALNGFVHTMVYIADGVVMTEEYWNKSLAMTFGDFMGCFVTVSLFHTAVIAFKSLKAQKYQ
jgi:hypothetical protein